MKKLLMALVVAGAFTTATAQEAAKAVAPQEAKPQLSKEEKAKLKEKQEADLAAAFKEAGLTDNEIKLAKEVMETYRAKRNEIKKSSMTEEEKTKKTQEVKDEEKTKLTEIMGSKFKLFKEAQKKQRAAAGN
jgi:hypothetical protein